MPVFQQLLSMLSLPMQVRAAEEQRYPCAATTLPGRLGYQFQVPCAPLVAAFHTPATYGSPERAAVTGTCEPVKVLLPAEAMLRWSACGPAVGRETFTSGRLPPPAPQQQTPVSSPTPRLATTPISLSDVLSRSCASPAEAALWAPAPAAAAPPPGAAAARAAPRAPPGLAPPLGSPSHGSVLHLRGACRPCAWFWKQGGCQNGRDCQHCHLCPQGEVKLRKKVKQTLIQLNRSGHPLQFAEEQAARNSSFGFQMESTSDSLAACTTSDHDTTIGTMSENEMNTVSEDDEEAPARVAALAPWPLCAVPMDVAEGHPGSALHTAGKCQPCGWFWKSGGCQRGQCCTFCHLCPEDEIKARKKSKHALLRLARQARQQSTKTRGKPPLV